MCLYLYNVCAYIYLSIYIYIYMSNEWPEETLQIFCHIFKRHIYIYIYIYIHSHTEKYKGSKYIYVNLQMY